MGFFDMLIFYFLIWLYGSGEAVASVLTWVGGIGLTLAASGYVIYACDIFNTETGEDAAQSKAIMDAKKEKYSGIRGGLKRTSRWSTIAVVLALLIPSQDSIKLIVAAKVANDIITSDKITEVSNNAFETMNTWLKKTNEEMKAKTSVAAPATTATPSK